MNKKGEMMAGLGIVLVMAIGVIAALAMFPAILGNIGVTTNTATAWNTTVTTSGTANATADLEGQELITIIEVKNETEGAPVDYLGADANVTLTECVSDVTTAKSICIQGMNADWVGVNVNVSYIYGADGYIDDSGGRALTTLIAIFAALAVAVFALMPVLKSGVLNLG